MEAVHGVKWKVECAVWTVIQLLRIQLSLSAALGDRRVVETVSDVRGEVESNMSEILCTFL